jgi:chitinase
MIRSKLTHTLKPGPAALGFVLMLLTTPSYGQAAADQEGPPHNVVYWDFADPDGTILPALVSSKYTVVIYSFVTPMPGTNCYLSPLPENAYWFGQQLKMAGKTVLIAFGGSDPSSSDYQACNNVIPGLANALAYYVGAYQFDGVDIDFEDTPSFQNGGPYDGVYFLRALTGNLYNALNGLLVNPPIITHAPQTPYWFPDPGFNWNSNYPAPPYLSIYQSNGDQIAWFNNQFYNNCEQPSGSSGIYDCTAQDKVDSYVNIVNAGVPSIKLVMGLPIANNAANPPPSGAALPFGPTGTGNDVYTLIEVLQGYYPNKFGGVMAWDLGWDVQDLGGSWSWAVSNTLKTYQAQWYAKDIQTRLCLDGGNPNAAVNTDGCNGLQSQYWQFLDNTIVNTQTGMCLDSNWNGYGPNLGSVYTDTCNGGNYQNWQFFGHTIRNRETGFCLDNGGGDVAYTDPCNGGNYQNWSGRSQGE